MVRTSAPERVATSCACSRRALVQWAGLTLGCRIGGCRATGPKAGRLTYSHAYHVVAGNLGGVDALPQVDSLGSIAASLSPRAWSRATRDGLSALRRCRSLRKGVVAVAQIVDLTRDGRLV
jgi:hypothetical protein